MLLLRAVKKRNVVEQRLLHRLRAQALRLSPGRCKRVLLRGPISFVT